MKAKLVPVYFEQGRNEDFDTQLANLNRLLADEAEFLEPVALGKTLPSEADAVIFPQLVGEAYRQVHHFKEITLPILVVTSEFGTMAMWDWEIATFLRSEGLTPYTPYNIEMTKLICRTLALKNDMKTTKFLIFQDNPGEGMQAEIFKRFFWWEEECVQRIQNTFGIQIVKKSFKQLAEDAKAIPDEDASALLKQWDIPSEGVSLRAFNNALKMYIAVRKEIENDPSIKGVGMNCLNESFYSNTTPCLTWNMLYEELGVMWACEGDILSLLTKYIVHKSLKVPTVMSNLYPFLMGETATKHEKIPGFPDVENFEDHVLIGHCGFFACMPKSFAAEWTLRPKVLGIVDEDATAIDARYPLGDLTIAQFHPSFSRMMLTEADLKQYVQYPGSDCRNGAMVKVNDGHRLMEALYSHHGCIIPGHNRVELSLMAKILGMSTDEV
jgi:hypothetical protein